MKKKSVLVAMSGGVDSSVSATLLKEKGYDVAGIGLKLLDSSLSKLCDVASSCCGKEGFNDARRVSGKIGIPFFILDVSKDFKTAVVNYFVKSYFLGKTPNPCIVCNEKIKFDILFKHAQKFDIDYIATGHYAKIIFNKNLNTYSIYRAKDKVKDQSYFLSTLKQKQLRKILFPLGDFKKSETRKMAQKFNLPVKDKKESQDICFLKDGKYVNFLKNYTGKKVTSGPIINKKGEKLGIHNGFVKYTVGQRRGLGISDRKPLYVIEINPQKNTLVVGYKKDAYRKKTYIHDVHWINNNYKGKELKDIYVKIRSNHRPALAKFELNYNNNAIIEFQEPQLAVTPGQAAVLYRDDELIGSGWIADYN